MSPSETTESISQQKLDNWKKEYTDGMKEFNLNFIEELGLSSVLEPHLPSLYLVFSHLWELNNHISEFKHKDAKLRFEEKMEKFRDFLFYSVSDLKLSFSVFGWIIQLYYARWALNRVSFFEALFFSIRWILRMQSDDAQWIPTRPWTLVDVTGVMGAIYYIGFGFLPFGKLNQLISYFGTIAYGNSLFMTFFLVNGSSKWFLGLSPISAAKNEDLYSSWNAVYTPIFHFMLYSFLFQSQIRISTWICSSERKDLKISVATLYWKQKLLITLDTCYRLLWRPAFFISPLISLLIYNTFAKPPLWQRIDSNLIDCSCWPDSWLFTIFLSIFIASVSGLWLTFLTFQIRYIIWEDDTRQKGICIFHFEKDLSFGTIY